MIIAIMCMAASMFGQTLEHDYLCRGFRCKTYSNGYWCETIWKSSLYRMDCLESRLKYDSENPDGGSYFTPDTVEVHLFDKYVDYDNVKDTVTTNGITKVVVKKIKRYWVREYIYTSVNEHVDEMWNGYRIKYDHNYVINMDIQPGVTYTAKRIEKTDPTAMMRYENGKLVVNVTKWYAYDIVEYSCGSRYELGIGFGKNMGVYITKAKERYDLYQVDAATYSKLDYKGAIDTDAFYGYRDTDFQGGRW